MVIKHDLIILTVAYASLLKWGSNFLTLTSRPVTLDNALKIINIIKVTISNWFITSLNKINSLA